MNQENPSVAFDIPSQTFEKFLEQLESDGVSTDVIHGLRKAILVDNTLTEAAIRKALFGDEQIT